MRAVVADVPRRVLGVRRRDERRPGRVGGRRRVGVLVRPRNRVPRPPEVEVVLVVPAVDPRVRRAQVRHREDSRAVGDVQPVPCDEVTGDGVPARDRRALPPTRVYVWSAVRVEPVADPSALTSLTSAAHCAMSSAGGPAVRNCDELVIRNGTRGRSRSRGCPPASCATSAGLRRARRWRRLAREHSRRRSRIPPTHAPAGRSVRVVIASPCRVLGGIRGATLASSILCTP